MEKYIETKLFVNLKQRLKRSNPKFEIAKLKLHKDRNWRPQSSYIKVERKEKEEPLILMSSKPKSKTENTYYDANNRAKTSTTQATSIPIMNQSKEKSMQRVRSAIGTRYNWKISDQKLISEKQSNDDRVLSPAAQFISRNKDLINPQSIKIYLIK